MKLFKSSKGQILLYFFIIASLIALSFAVWLEFRLTEIQRSQRGEYIDALIGECGANTAAIITGQYSEAESGAPAVIELRNKALLNFIKVRNKVFQFSTVKMVEWVEFQKTLAAAGMLSETGGPVQIEPDYAQDVFDTQKNMVKWLNMARAHDNNFLK